MSRLIRLCLFYNCPQFGSQRGPKSALSWSKSDIFRTDVHVNLNDQNSPENECSLEQKNPVQTEADSTKSYLISQKLDMFVGDVLNYLKLINFHL